MKKGLNYIVWFFERLFLLWKIFIIFRNSRAFVLRKLKIDDINSLRMEANNKMKNISGELPVGTKVMWGINYFKAAMAKKFSFQSRPLSCKNDTPPLTNSTKFIQRKKIFSNIFPKKFAMETSQCASCSFLEAQNWCLLSIMVTPSLQRYFFV